jgi:TPR repeat protein
MSSSGTQAVPAPPRRWSLFGFGGQRAEAAALEQRIAVLQSQLSECKARAGHREAWTHAVRAALALLVFVLGYAAGVYHGAIRQSIGDVFPVLGVVGGASGIDAGEDAYAKGRYPLALRLMRPLAEQGDARAQAVMGLMYYHGRGVKQDDVEAAKWFRLAADQDEPRAQFNLGVMHAEGQGVPQDYVEAIKWYRLAAEQGEARAQFNLGVSYAEGQGTDQNYILAYMWFNLAAPRFLPSEADRRRVALHNRDLTASRMSREQIAEAQRMSREWQPKGTTSPAG